MLITPCEAPILHVDLPKLTRVECCPKTVDTARVHITLVLIPGLTNLVEITKRQPLSAWRRL